MFKFKLFLFVIDHKQDQLDLLMNYFSKVIQNIDKIVTQLQKVTQDTSLIVESKYHKYLYSSLSLTLTYSFTLSLSLSPLSSLYM